MSTNRLCTLIATTLLSVTMAGGTAHAATVVNGDFAGGNLNGWTAYAQPGSAGQWTTYSGVKSPISDRDVAAPASGPAAIADQLGEASTILYQDITLESALAHKLDLDYLADNKAASWAMTNPFSLDYNGDAKQHARIDILKSTAPPNSTDSADVLQTIYASQAGDPLSTGWRHATADISAFAGQTLKLRFGIVGNNNVVLLAVDNVVLVSTDVTAPAIRGFRTAKSKFRSKGRAAGSDVSFTTDDAGTATIAILQQAKGKRSGKRCVKPSKKLAKKKNCKRYVTLSGSTKLTAVAGLNKFKFSGKVRGKSLKPGSYKLQLTLKNAAGLSSTSTSISFKIKK